MNTLDIIRNAGHSIAMERGILNNAKIEQIVIDEKVVENFIERVKDDLFEFNTIEQFDSSYFNLFCRAFMYCYGKGAEIAFFTRIGNVVCKIDYEFDKLMQSICGDNLPDHFRFNLNRKSGDMLDMYIYMFELTKGPQEKIISEGLTFPDCIRTILHGGFHYGKELCLTFELSNNNRLSKYQEQVDIPYDSEHYDQKYKPEHFKIVGYRFGDFNEIKDRFKE